MPNVSAHIGAALKVKEKLNIQDDIIIYGAIFPDIVDMNKTSSHFKEMGTFYLIPNLKYFRENNDLSNPFYLGYYLHLYLDYYYLEDYLENNCKGIDVFRNGIYKDYDIVNKDLIKHYNIDPNYIESVLRKYSNEIISDRKLETNIRCLSINKDGELKFLETDKFISFIDRTIEKFINEIE